MSGFRWRHFCGEVILWAVRWYCRYGVSYRDLEEMLRERGVEVDHTTLYRWVQRYAPELEIRLARYRSRMSFSWRVDETYVKVKGRWRYLYRAIDKDGTTLDFSSPSGAAPRRPSASSVPHSRGRATGVRG
jgi:IS6 family transposase